MTADPLSLPAAERSTCAQEALFLILIRFEFNNGTVMIKKYVFTSFGFSGWKCSGLLLNKWLIQIEIALLMVRNDVRSLRYPYDIHIAGGLWIIH